jgi:hypothetical protein
MNMQHWRMALTMRSTGLGSGIDKDSTAGLGGWAHLPDPRRPRQSALVLVDDRQRPDDTGGSRRDLGGGQGAVSKEQGPVGRNGRNCTRLNKAA